MGLVIATLRGGSQSIWPGFVLHILTKQISRGSRVWLGRAQISPHLAESRLLNYRCGPLASCRLPAAVAFSELLASTVRARVSSGRSECALAQFFSSVA